MKINLFLMQRHLITLTWLFLIDYFGSLMQYIYGHILTATITRADKLSLKSCTAAITNVECFLLIMIFV